MKTLLAQLISKHLRQMDLTPPSELVLDTPKLKEHGDLSSNVAMVLAKSAKRRPQELAEALAQALGVETTVFEKIEVKGPGFLNFFLKPTAYHRALKSLWRDDGHLERVDLGKGARVLVEFVSANPTGPMHVGHGRNAVVGDCLARLLEATGFAMT